MNASLSHPFSELRAAAELLQQQVLGEIVTSVETHMQSSQICLLLLGESDGKHYALANTLLGEALLPDSLYPARTLPLHLSHDTKSVIELCESSGMVSLLTPADLSEYLFVQARQEDPLNSFGSGARTRKIAVRGQIKMLENCTLTLENIERLSEAQRDQWTRILCGADYALFVLKATAILSRTEREIIRERLMPVMGAGRFALVIDQMESLSPEERKEILDFVRIYFKGQEAVPILLPYEARPAGDAQSQAATWQQEIRDHVQHEVVEKHSRLRSHSTAQGLRLSVEAIEDTARRTLREMESMASRIEALQKSADVRTQELSQRSAEVRNRLELHLDTFLKENTMRDVEGFAGVVRQHLAAEIEDAGATSQTAQALPGYLEALWAEYFAHALPDLRAEMLATVKPIADAATREVQAVTEGEATDWCTLASDFVLTTSEMPFSLPRIQTQVDDMQKIGQTFLGSFSGLLGLSSTAAAGDETQSAAQKMARTIQPALREIEQQIKSETERKFTATTEQYAEAITRFYQQAIDHLHASVQQERDKGEHLLSRRTEIEALLTTQVPQWRDQIAAAPVN